MSCVTSNRISNVLLLCFVQSFLASQSYGQYQRIELTKPANSPPDFSRMHVGGIILWQNTHAIVHLGTSLQRFSLVDAKEEVKVYDLKRIPSLANRRFNAILRSSGDGNWILLESAGQDATTGCNSYLFDSSAWSCKDEITPVSQWNSEDLNWGVGSQIFEEPGLIVTPKDLGNRSVLEIRQLDAPAEIMQSVKIGGRYITSWWDENRGLVVLCKAPPFPRGRNYTLSRIDIASGKITNRADWQLPFEFGIFHRMPETATILQQSDGPAGHENYLVEFGRPAKKLMNKIPLPPRNLKCPSKNGRYLAGNYLPSAQHHYLLDLAMSKELASFDARNELPLAVSDDGRFYLTLLENGDGKSRQLQIVLYDFQESLPDAPNGYRE